MQTVGPDDPKLLPQLHPLSIARMLCKQAQPLILTACAITLLGTVVTFLLPPIYRAETLILVDSQRIPENYVSGSVRTELQDRLATITQQVMSSTRLQKIIESYDLYPQARKYLPPEDIVEKLRADIQVKLERGWTQNRPGAFRVSFQAPTATLAADVANQIGGLFIEENLKSREASAEGTAEFIQDQLNQAKTRLDDLEGKIGAYKREHNGELPQQENVLIGSLTRLQLELQGIQDSIHRAQQSKLMIESALAMATSSQSALADLAAKAAAERATVQTVNQQDREEAELLRALERAAVLHTDQHPDVRNLTMELARVRERKAKSVEAPPPSRPAISLDAAQANVRERERTANMELQLKLAIQEADNLQAARKQVLESLSAAQARVGQLPLREQEMAALTRDYEMAKVNYRSLLDKKTAAQMSTEMERRQKAERFTVLDAARAPGRPFSPNRLMGSLLATAIGLTLGLGFAVARELHHNTVLGEWELPPDVLVLGRVPHIPPNSSEGSSAKIVSRRRVLWGAASATLLFAAVVTSGHFVWGWY